MSDLSKVRKVVFETVASDFGKARILDIRVTPYVDFDESESLRVEVLYDGRPRDLDVNKRLSMVHRIRPRLEAIGETRFPIFSYISKSDLKATKFEAA